LVGYFKEYLDLAIAAARTFQSAGELVERERLSARPHKRFHIQLGTCVAVDRNPIVAALGRLAGHKAPDADTPAELPGFSERFDEHESTGPRHAGRHFKALDS
jgi:hypothetical protein